jgi:hypothetical protein
VVLAGAVAAALITRRRRAAQLEPVLEAA